MPIQIAPAEEILTSKYARWGFYGANGVGKTTFVQSIPQMLQVLVVSADDENTQPLKGLPHVSVAKVTAWEDVADILSMIQNPGGTPLFREFLKKLAAHPASAALAQKRLNVPEVKSGAEPFWQVIVFDTWTRMQALAANMIVGYEMVKPGQETRFAKTAPKLPKGYEAWQQIGALAGEWLRYFQRVPMHSIFMMQEARRESKFEDEAAIIGPALTPAALVHAKDTLSMVGRMYVSLIPTDAVSNGSADATSLDVTLGDDDSPLTIRENVKEVRKLLIGKHDHYFTKGPTHKLGYVVVEPTWAKLSAVFS